jgi:flagellum-specific peptidoglycan hydrolase FlgJ
MIAQWALESKWGERPVGHFNCFGIKRAARHANFCTVATREFLNGKSVVQNLEFADYDSIEDSCRDYAWLITQGSPYRAAWQRYQNDHDLHALIAAIAGTYATDPNYAHLAAAIAGQTNVAQAIGAARQETVNA